MIDNFSLGLTHGVMLLAMLILVRRPLLDREPSPRDAPARKKRRA